MADNVTNKAMFEKHGNPSSEALEFKDFQGPLLGRFKDVSTITTHIQTDSPVHC